MFTLSGAPYTTFNLDINIGPFSFIWDVLLANAPVTH